MKYALSKAIASLLLMGMAYGAYCIGPMWSAICFLLISVSILMNKVTNLEKAVSGLIDQLSVKEVDGQAEKVIPTTLQ